MLTPDELERERLESRRKAQLDYNTAVKVSRMEGREEEKKIGTIRLCTLCESFLGRPETPAEQLASLTLEKLTLLADDLQAQVRKAR
jgi:hypothetical protein